MIPPKAKKRVIKRKKPGTGPSKMYFGPGTQKAIIKYQGLDDELFRFENLVYVLDRNEFEEIIEDWVKLEKEKEIARVKKIERINDKEENEFEKKPIKNRIINESYIKNTYLPENYESFLEEPKEKKEKLNLAKQKRDTLKSDKDDLYTKEIQPAFDKLVENLIFLYGFMSLHDSYEDLKADCVSNLYSSINKYDDSKGFKAFSYFNIVAKNFLIIKTKKSSSKIKLNVSFDDEDAMGIVEIEALKEHCTLPSIDDLFIEVELSGRISSLLTEIKKRLKKDSEIKCIDSIISIFNTIEDIDFLNKRAIFHLIREQSGLSPKQLTTTMSIIKKHYKEIKQSNEFGIYR